MKNIFIIVCLLMVVGCGNAVDRSECFSEVKKSFPNSTVEPISPAGFRFVVKTPTGDIYYVETNNFTNPEVSLKRKLF